MIEVSSRCRNSLWAGRSGDRIPLGAGLYIFLQTSPAAHPASYAMVLVMSGDKVNEAWR